MIFDGCGTLVAPISSRASSLPGERSVRSWRPCLLIQSVGKISRTARGATRFLSLASGAPCLNSTLHGPVRRSVTPRRAIPEQPSSVRMNAGLFASPDASRDAPASANAKSRRTDATRVAPPIDFDVSVLRTSRPHTTSGLRRRGVRFRSAGKLHRPRAELGYTGSISPRFPNPFVASGATRRDA